MTPILGAGLAGLSWFWCLRHDKCQLFELSDHLGVQVLSVVHNGLTLAYGPQILLPSYTEVRDFFA
jgi:protoporphyrinogen oxidase